MKRKLLIMYAAAAFLFARTLSAQETMTFDSPETAAICGYRALWDTPIIAAADGVRVVTDDQIKDRGGVAPFAVNLRENGAKPAALAFDAIHRYLLVRFPDAAEKIAAKLNDGFTVEKAELILPFADEELWPEGNPNGIPPGGGYLYRANWGVDAMYRKIRPTWHAIAWALRRPWKADPQTGPTFNAYINGAGYWTHFGAQDDKSDRVPVQFGPAPVNYKEPARAMDISAALNDPAFGDSAGTRLRRLADCGFIVRKWETYDHLYYSGCYEWGTGTGPRAIIIQKPKLAVTFKKADKPDKVELPPAADIAKISAELKQGDKGGKPTAVMPTAEDLKKMYEKYRWKRLPDMPEWQWQRIQELFSAAYGQGSSDEPFWFEFVPSHIKNRLRVDKDGKWSDKLPPDNMKVYEAYVDDILGKPYRGWNGFEAGPVLVTWFLYRDALPLPVQECYKNFWTAWLMPDRETALPPKATDINCLDGSLVHPMVQDDRVGKGPPPDPLNGILDNYVAKTGDWRGNKSFYRSGFNYCMSTMNFNNTASMGALLGGSIIGSERAIADGRYGQANFPLKLWTWLDGTAQEEGDDYYFGVTMRAQKMVADFGPEPIDRLLGKSMLLKGMTMMADTYHPGLRRYITGASRTSPYFRLVTQDGLYGIIHTLSRQGALTDLGAAAKDLPEGEQKFGHEFPPEQVARTAAYSPYAPVWYQHVIDEKPLPYEVTSAYKQWNGITGSPIMKKTYLGRNYGLASMSVDGAFLPGIAQWRRQDKTVSSSRELGTMFMRMGINQTRFMNDAPGWIQSYGTGAVLQQGPKLIVSYSPAGAGLDTGKNISSIQASLAFFSYEQPKPSWEIYADGKLIPALPFSCKSGTKLVIKDGVTWIGVVPLAGSNLGVKDEVLLREGDEQKYFNDAHHAKAALVIDNFIIQGDKPLDKNADWKGIDKSATGFAVEFADASDYPDFPAFLKHMQEAKASSKVDADKGVHEISYASGKDMLEMGALTTRPEGEIKPDASFTFRKVNGASPDLPPGVERLSPFSIQSSTGDLQLNGAALRTSQGQMAVLQHEPVSGTVLAANPLAELNKFSLKAPGGVEATASGKVGMLLITLEDKNSKVSIEHAFLTEQLKNAEAADSLLLFGFKPETAVTLNGAALKSLATVDVEGRKALAIPLKEKKPVQ